RRGRRRPSWPRPSPRTARWRCARRRRRSPGAARPTSRRAWCCRSRPTTRRWSPRIASRACARSPSAGSRGSVDGEDRAMTSMRVSLTDEQRALKAGVAEICKRYPGEYWRQLDQERAYPEAFVTELTRAGYLGALVPQEYGGVGLGILEGGLILETINACGGNGAACHAQMYIMGTVLRHGSEEQKRRYLPKIATGELRLQAFGVTEPNSGSDTTKLQTTAVRRGDRYVVNGQKMFISRVLQSDLMLLLARTTPVDKVKRRTDGLSVFLFDLRQVQGLEVRPLRMMMNHS